MVRGRETRDAGRAGGDARRETRDEPMATRSTPPQKKVMSNVLSSNVPLVSRLSSHVPNPPPKNFFQLFFKTPLRAMRRCGKLTPFKDQTRHMKRLRRSENDPINRVCG